MDHDLPDREEIACALDTLESWLAKEGLYQFATDAGSSAERIRLDDDEIEKLATALATRDARIAELEAECEALRADVVWLLAHKMIGYGDRISYAKEPRSWSLRKELDHDGTPDGILRAVREAREG